MKRYSALVSIFALGIAIFAGEALAAGSKGSLHVEVAFQQEVHNSGDAVLVDVSITNTGKGAARILRWFTAQNGVEEPLFDVRVDGREVEYIGRHYKRPEPTDKDYIVIQPGRTVTTTVDLAEYYEMSATGYYSVRYAVASYDLFAKYRGVMMRQQTLTSNSAASWAEGRQAKGKPTPPPPVGNTSFEKCSVDQANTIVQARSDAAAYSQNASEYLNGNSGLRYTTWFGTYDDIRYDRVAANFLAIDETLDNEQMTFNCGCRQNYYAYVYTNDPYRVYVCKVFWQAPATGTDSKAGTIIHETSHFDVVAGTDDYVYGQSGAKNLALTNPNQAIANADNHEYFAENTPSLP